MIKFELENWEVSTSKPTSPLYRVTDIFYDEDYSVGVSKTSTSEILGVAKLRTRAGCNFNRIC